jgi:hypothetical protein
VTLKAVARAESLAAPYYYRWDADGDGTWDYLGTTPVVANGNWYRNNCYMLDGKFTYPALDPAVATRKLYMAIIEVAETVDPGTGIPSGSKFATYPVMIYGDVPLQANANSATDDQLRIMREVAIDDALWYLHKQMLRSGVSTAQITGYLPQSSAQYSIGVSGLFLKALLANAHNPAYTPGTYNDYGNTLQPDWYTRNNYRWNIDPYSEDAIRIVNFLLNNIQYSAVNATDEEDDGKTPISGTNDNIGYYFNNSELNERSFAVTALAKCMLGGSVVQTGAYTAGRLFEFIIQQFVDYVSYGQIKSGTNTGGWYYSPGTSLSVSYLTGGTIIMLKYIEESMGNFHVIIPTAVKDRIASILFRSQNGDGGVGWEIGYASSFEHAGLFMGGCAWLGWNQFSTGDATSLGNPYITLTKAQARAVFDKYQLFIANNWTLGSSGYNGVMNNFGNWSDGNYNSGSKLHSFVYSILNTAEGAKNTVPTPKYFINSSGTQYEWERQYIIDCIKGQYDGGYLGTVTGNYWLIDMIASAVYPGTTAYAINSVIPCLYDPDPLAAGIASPMEVLAGCAGSNNGKVNFSHQLSFHESPNRAIAQYQWIFGTPASVTNDYFNQYDWSNIAPDNFSSDGKAYRTASKDQTVTYRFNNPGTFNAALRVVDDNSPPKTNIYLIKNITVTAPATLPPVIDAGGPYKINSGNQLILAGTAVNPNSGCYPADNLTFKWDINQDGIYDFLSGAGTVSWDVLSGLNLPVNTRMIIQFVSQNSFAQSASDTALLTINDGTVDIGDIPEAGDKTRIAVYPNPVKDHIKISCESGFEKNERVEIVNSQGKVILSELLPAGEHDHAISLRKMKDGMYLARIFTPVKEELHKFIKQ